MTVTTEAPATEKVSDRLNVLAEVFRSHQHDRHTSWTVKPEESTELRLELFQIAIAFAKLQSVLFTIHGPAADPRSVEILANTAQPIAPREIASLAAQFVRNEWKTFDWRDSNALASRCDYWARQAAELEKVKADPRIVSVRCSDCGAKIDHPFSRRSGPIAFVHRGSYRPEGCQLIVTPDPSGEDHRVTHVSAPHLLLPMLAEALRSAELGE